MDINNLSTEQLIEKVDNQYVNTCNTSSITVESKETRVTSLRINIESYNIIKDRSSRDSIPISYIVNRALMHYLKNYI